MANPNAPNFPRTSGSTNRTSKTPPDLHSGYETAGTNPLEKLRVVENFAWRNLSFSELVDFLLHRICNPKILPLIHEQTPGMETLSATPSEHTDDSANSRWLRVLREYVNGSGIIVGSDID
jgi:hypothetical protein